jgi:hypothetical protein
MSVSTTERRIVIIDAPSNLGLRLPAEGTVPGVYKFAGALRNERLLERLDESGELSAELARCICDAFVEERKGD